MNYVQLHGFFSACLLCRDHIRWSFFAQRLRPDSRRLRGVLLPGAARPGRAIVMSNLSI